MGKSNEGRTATWERSSKIAEEISGGHVSADQVRELVFSRLQIPGCEHRFLLEGTQTLEARQLRCGETEGTTGHWPGFKEDTEPLDKRNQLGPFTAVKDKALSPAHALDQLIQ